MPEREGSYQKNSAMAGMMAGGREKFVEARLVTSLAAEFNASLGDEWQQERHGLGKLILVAVVDAPWVIATQWRALNPG